MTGHSALNCLKFSTVALFMLFLQTAEAQYNFAELDKKLDFYKKELGENAVTLVYKNGKIIYQKSMGDFDARTQAPVASCSKWLTAALVMTFVDEGKLSLDDYVSKYIPEFTSYGKGYITIRQCLSHTTGIHSERIGLGSIIQLRKYSSLEEEVNDFMSKHELDAQPGQQFFYSAIGLNTAGRVLEIIGKKSFDQLMTQRIFRPLGMKGSTFYSEKATNPSGGAVCTANDYMNFLTMLLNKGMFNGKRILSEQSVEAMETVQTNAAAMVYAPPAAEKASYGLGGWVLETGTDGKSTVVASPGLFGTWPLIDKCRGYACIFFVKTLLKGETKRAMYDDLKNTIDEAIQSECK
ncbi:MAG TPA: serine hydrolase domain-containing protein [Panacibacter sp.]|nr:serine hydrolase domain-containing protein [Panacibacter sp.]HNP43903.1 serine hydrolase domain-containing protein [Panacibacter sp.]